MRDHENRRLRVLALLGTAYFPPFIDDLAELHREGMGPRAWLLELPCELTQLDQRFLWPCQPQLAPPFSFDLAPRSVALGLEFSFDLAPPSGRDCAGSEAGSRIAAG